MNSILKKILVFILIIIFIIAFSSSYKALNIDNLAFVVALGIDVSETKKIKVTFQFVNPPSTSEGSNQESKIIEDSIDCNSLSNAINIMNAYLARRLDLTHCRIIVFSEEIAKEGISNYIYSLMNDVQVRPTANIIVSKCNADYYIKSTQPSLETSITRYYDIFPDSTKYTGYMSNATIGNFFNALVCNYCEPYTILGGVSSSASKSSQSLVTNDENTTAGSSPISGTRDSENIGMAIFKEDKLVGELTAIETACFNLLRNELYTFLISIPDPKDENKELNISITPKSSIKINAKIVNGSPYIKIDSKLSGKIYSMSENSSYLDQSTLNEIANSCNNYLKSILSEYLYKTTLKFKSDVNGLGKYILSEFPTDKEFYNYNWSNNFINSTFNINIKTTIDSGFLLTKT